MRRSPGIALLCLLCALLVVGADSPTLGGEARLDRLLDEVACPVLLAR